MIVRILGEGQFNVAEVEQDRLQGFDEDIETAVEAKDEAGLHDALLALRSFIVEHGSPVGDDFLGKSDIVVPYPDADIADIEALLTDDGLIPDVLQS